MKWTILALMVLAVGCAKVNHAVDTADSIDNKINTLSGNFDDAKCQITEALSFDDMLKPEYGEYLDPIPFEIMVVAKKFSNCLTPDDAVQLVHVWMKRLNEGNIDIATPTQAQIDSFNHDQLQVLSALQAVCGFISDAKVQQIVAAQIYTDGRYRDAAEQLLMLRVRFLRDVQLEADLFSSPLNSVGEVTEAVGYADSIDMIARYPFAKEIGIKMSSFMAPIGPITETFDSGLALQEWKKLQTKAQRGMTLSAKAVTGDPNSDQKLFQQQQTALNAAMAKVAAKIASWTPKQ